jgi:hypothetical protein
LRQELIATRKRFCGGGAGAPPQTYAEARAELEP